ncbi:MAG: hypothetical protein RLZZ142_2695, partial [Verrucomicrobiota bacterium]
MRPTAIALRVPCGAVLGGRVETWGGGQEGSGGGRGGGSPEVLIWIS